MKQKHTDYYKLNRTALTDMQTATWQSKKQQFQTFIQTQESLPNSGNILMVFILLLIYSIIQFHTFVLNVMTLMNH